MYKHFDNIDKTILKNIQGGDDYVWVCINGQYVLINKSTGEVVKKT